MDKGRRKANFLNEETLLMLEEILLEREVILSKLHGSLTIGRKRAVWESITQKINARFANNRSVAEVKKRFKDVKRVVQLQRDSLVKTGGGKPLSTSIFTEPVLAILGATSAIANGISVRGMDSLNTEQSPNGSEDLFETLTFSVARASSPCSVSATVIPSVFSEDFFIPLTQQPISPVALCSTVHSSMVVPAGPSSAVVPDGPVSPSMPVVEPSIQSRSASAADLGARFRTVGRAKRGKKKSTDDALLNEWLQSEIDKNRSTVRWQEAHLAYMRFKMGHSADDE